MELGLVLKIWHVELSLNVHLGLLKECGVPTTGIWATTNLTILLFVTIGLNQANGNRVKIV